MNTEAKNDSAKKKSDSTKKKNESNKKDSQLIIRINGQQRDEFVALCEDLDTSAAREIRHFIKKFLAEHAQNSED